MLNQTGVETKSYGNRKTILVDEMNSSALPCLISNAGVTADSDGKKIVKAGTPVYGSLMTRNTAMTVTGAENAKPCGVILHDVDVTKGTANSQVLYFGFIDVTKLDTDVATKIKAAEANLKMIQLVSK